MYIVRGIGGTIYLTGAVLLVINLIKTAKAGSFIAEETSEAPALSAQPLPAGKAYWHSIIERRPVQMLVMSLIVVSVGGAIEIIPTFIVKENVPTISTVKPYTPLELQGRDIYIREGCYTCHSQMVRPFRDEVARYGDYSKAGESVYDHPFQWGSKRTGPDLARLANKYPNSWHYRHMNDPEEISQGSIMPPYPWLLDNDLDISTTPGKIRAMQTLGVPYPEGYDQKANNDLKMQADEIAADLKANNIKAQSGKEIIALIAYLQRLGADLKKAPEAEIKSLH